MKKVRKRDTYCNVFLLAKEAHPNIVPQRGAFRHGAGHHPVFGEGNIKISMGLHQAASCQGGL